MPLDYDSLQHYVLEDGREEIESAAVNLEYYVMVSSCCYIRLLLTRSQLRDMSLELDRAAGDVMIWQYGAAEALNYICILHGGDEEVARVVVAARYVVVLSWRVGSCRRVHVGHVCVVVVGR